VVTRADASSSSSASTELASENRRVSAPSSASPADGKFKILDRLAAAQIGQLETNCREFGIELHALGSEGQGIVHVIGPELGSPSRA
jgi:homoaconitase/3-isopropylmalate dehydratase large subunit